MSEIRVGRIAERVASVGVAVATGAEVEQELTDLITDLVKSEDELDLDLITDLCEIVRQARAWEFVKVFECGMSASGLGVAELVEK